MLVRSEIDVDVASYPEFDNLVAEVTLGPRLTIVISKEPNEGDFGIAFYGDAGSTRAPSCSRPSDTNRVTLSDVLAAIDLGRKALEGP